MAWLRHRATRHVARGTRRAAGSHLLITNCRTSLRVTIPTTRPPSLTSSAGDAFDRSFVTASTACDASTVGNASSITSPTVASRKRVLSRPRVVSPYSVTLPTHSSPSITGSCDTSRSEEHTSELQSRQYLVCRL